MTRLERNWEGRIGRRLKLRDLDILSTIAECGSMAKAARQLGMSQPAVSESIAGLETTLRVRLLDRSPKGVEPTIYARALITRGNVAFDELKQGIRDIEFLANPGVGEVRIGCPESLMAGFVPAILERMSRRYPRVVTHVVNAQPGEQDFHALHGRRLDLMLGRILVPLRDTEIDAEVLCHDRLFVVAGARSPWARRRRKIAIEELVHERWVMFPKDSLIALHFAKAMEAHGLVPTQESVASFSVHVRTQLLATGRFLTLMHGSTLRYYAKPWSLKALPIDLAIPPVPIAVLTVRHRTLSPVVRLFIEQSRITAKSLKGDSWT